MTAYIRCVACGRTVDRIRTTCPFCGENPRKDFPIGLYAMAVRLIREGHTRRFTRDYLEHHWHLRPKDAEGLAEWARNVMPHRGSPFQVY